MNKRYISAFRVILWVIAIMVYTIIATKTILTNPGLFTKSVNLLIKIVNNHQVAEALVVLVFVMPLFVITNIIINFLSKILFRE
jgi:hypothetical protein